MKFKPGQEVTPNIKNEEWKIIHGSFIPIPEFGKIYTVEGYPNEEFPEMLTLVEIEGNFFYWEERFDPILPARVLEIDLEDAIMHQNLKEFDKIQRY